MDKEQIKKTITEKLPEVLLKAVKWINHIIMFGYVTFNVCYMLKFCQFMPIYMIVKVYFVSEGIRVATLKDIENMLKAIDKSTKRYPLLFDVNASSSYINCYFMFYSSIVFNTYSARCCNRTFFIYQ